MARPRTHAYQADPDVPADHKGRGRCLCARLESAPCHELPDASEAAAEQARRLGERGDR